MEEIIKQQLNYYSNTDFLLPNHRVLSIPRYDRHTSFSEISDWGNSNKFSSGSKLPRLQSKTERPVGKVKNISNFSTSNSNFCCPVKQMDINLEPLKHLQESYYCQYLKKKSKREVKQYQFLASYEKEKRSVSIGRQTMGVGKLQEIIKRQKNSRFNVNIEDYLRTTQLCQNSPKNFPK